MEKFCCEVLEVGNEELTGKKVGFCESGLCQQRQTGFNITLMVSLAKAEQRF